MPQSTDARHIYAIGDIQGCYDPFRELLAKLQFDPVQDQLWLVGDLVNRGPKSLEVLQYCYAHRHAIRVVLGNHDLYCLMRHYELMAAVSDDTLGAIFTHPDRDKLMQWLQQQPLMFQSDEYCVVHAGIYPFWDLDEAAVNARAVEAVLQGPDALDFLPYLYGDQPDCWDPGLEGHDRWRFIVNAFTRMRCCDAAGRLLLAQKGAPVPGQDVPWFSHPDRCHWEQTILFGHWASLKGESGVSHAVALDAGCVWGEWLKSIQIK